MSPEIIGYIGIALLMFLIFMKMWVGAAMAFVGLLGYFWIEGIDNMLILAGTVPYSSISDEVVAAVPLFILMGVVVSTTGVSGDLYETSHKWLGSMRGGLSMATVVACGGFAAVSGSSMAAAATMGKVAIPEMKKFNYDQSLAAGSVAAGGTLGILIPPSMGFILYGILTEVSIGRLFMAGVIPGILEVVFYIGVILIMCRFNPKLAPAGPKYTLWEKILSLKKTWPMLVLFSLIMGGIYAGWFTPTEAGAIGAFGAITVSLISRKLTKDKMISSMLETAQTTAMIVLTIAGAFIFMKLMAVSRLPMMLANSIGELSFPPIVILFVIIILYIVLGMFLDIYAAILLTLPILFPVILNLGFNPIWYGVIMVRVMEMGLITPPMGMNVFVLQGVTNIPLSKIYRGVVPFIIADVLHVILLVSFPILSLYLPNRM